MSHSPLKYSSEMSSILFFISEGVVSNPGVMSRS